MEMDIYFSYACRDSYLVYAWLNDVKRSGLSLQVNWLPFAIQMDDPLEYWKQPWETAGSELRGFIAAEAARRQGAEFFSRFHDALEHAVHERLLELGDEDTLTSAAQESGVNLKAFRMDWHDPQLTWDVQRKHLEGSEKWKVFGTPTLIFPNQRSFHLELNQLPAKIDARDTFQAFESLAVTFPYIGQFRQITAVS